MPHYMQMCKNNKQSIFNIDNTSSSSKSSSNELTRRQHKRKKTRVEGKGGVESYLKKLGMRLQQHQQQMSYIVGAKKQKGQWHVINALSDTEDDDENIISSSDSESEEEENKERDKIEVSEEEHKDENKQK
eukprot:1472571-Ditylum_brightwellii.AAC.1